MLDNNLNSPSGAAEDGRDRSRQSSEARPLTDREVPLGRPGMSAELHAWLDGELPESSVRKAELTRDVELWSRVNEETARRREIQTAHNLEHGITPMTVIKSADQVRFITRVADARVEEPQAPPKKGKRVAEKPSGYEGVDLEQLLKLLEQQMKQAAVDLDFETAAQLRDQIFELKTRLSDAAAASR